MNHKKIILSSVIITVVLWFLVYLIGSQFYLFQAMCEQGIKCSTQFEVYWRHFNWFILLGFLFMLSIGYIISAVKTRKKNG